MSTCKIIMYKCILNYVYAYMCVCVCVCVCVCNYVYMYKYVCIHDHSIARQGHDTNPQMCGNSFHRMF